MKKKILLSLSIVNFLMAGVMLSHNSYLQFVFSYSAGLLSLFVASKL